MDFEQCFPFFKLAPIKGTSIKKMSISQIISEYDGGFSSDLKNLRKYANFISPSKRWVVYRLYPSDVVFFVGNELIERMMFWALKTSNPNKPDGDDSVMVEERVVDYSFLCKSIDLNEVDSQAEMWSGGGTMVQKVYNPSEVSVIVSSFSNGVVKDIRPKVMSLLYQMNNTPVKFPVLESFDVDAPVSSREMGIKKSTDTVEFQIKTYLQNRSSSERIPLLLGNTGLAKSAMIKSLASQYPHVPSKGIYGYRVIDLRCAFLDKLDLEGLVQKSADGKFTYNAPMASILTCTDDYLNFVRTSYNSIVRRLSEPDVVGLDESSNLKVTLNSMKDRFDFESRTPILFFDEITRAPKSIRNAFTIILNQKVFQGRKMSIARLISATNYPAEMDLARNPTLMSVFETDEISDIATLDRFESIKITPKDVFLRWLDWARQTFKFKKGKKSETRYNIHPYVIEYILPVRAKPDEGLSEEQIDEAVGKAYNFQNAVDSSGNDFDKIATTPFPNFRAWELVSNHLYAVVDKKCTYNAALVGNLIGTLGGGPGGFTSWLFDNHTEFQTSNEQTLAGTSKASSVLSAGVEDCMASGVPMLMLGVSGIGKTTRVKNICRGKAHLHMVNLAHADRTTVMGIPVSTNLLKTLMPVGTEDVASDPLIKEIRDNFGKNQLPQEVSIFAPDLSLSNAVHEAHLAKRPLVLFFDEVNRGSQYVWNSVFEAVSDRRYAGVTFPEGLEVWVVCAANPVGEVTRLDPAFTARFAVFNHPVYTTDDVANIIKFMEDEKYDPRIIAYFKSKSADEVLMMIRSIESRTLEKSAASTRAFTDLNNLLSSFAVNPPTPLCGRVLRPEDPVDSQVIGWLNSSDDFEKNNEFGNLLDQVIALVNRIPSNWAPLYGDDVISFLGKDFTAASFLKETRVSLALWKSEFDKGNIKSFQYNKYKEILTSIKKTLAFFEDKAKRFRDSQFTSILGSVYSVEFSSLYNSMTGDQVLQVQDVVDEDTANRWVSMKFKGADSSAFAELGHQLMIEYHDFWKSRSTHVYLFVLQAIFREMKSIHQHMFDLISLYRTDALVAEFFNRAAVNKDFDRNMVNSVMGLLFNEAQADAYYARKTAGTLPTYQAVFVGPMQSGGKP